MQVSMSKQLSLLSRPSQNTARQNFTLLLKRERESLITINEIN